MNQVFDPLNILILAVAVVVFFRLRSVLGTRTGNEKTIDPFAKPDTPETPSRGGDDNVVRLPSREPAEGPREEDETELVPVWHGYAEKDSPLAAGLSQIAKADPDFAPGEFLTGAKAAYEMIVTAFAEGDKSALKPLLSREVFEGFSSAIADRNKSGLQMQSRFVGINKADIVQAGVTGRKANVTIKFISDLITSTTDRSGEVVDGDPQAIQEITDVWTFERDTASRDPNWRLIATEAT